MQPCTCEYIDITQRLVRNPERMRECRCRMDPAMSLNGIMGTGPSPGSSNCVRVATLTGYAKRAVQHTYVARVLCAATRTACRVLAHACMQPSGV